MSGRMWIEGPPPGRLVDPLAALPAPEDDAIALRTWPGLPEQGVVRFTRIDEGTWSFHAILPRRYGDVGATRHGLFANGFWYPQPLERGEIPVVSWSVTLRIPEGTMGAVGESWGEGVVHWEGEAERVPIAVLPRGRATPLAEDVALLTRGRPRKVLVRELRDALEALPGEERDGVIVEAPLRRRLVRTGPGLGYVSDRAFRVTPGTRRFHRLAVGRGVATALADLPHPYMRALAGAGASAQHARSLRGRDARRVLRLGAWMPGIDALLHDRRMPFVAEVLEEEHPGDPLRDDLMEVFDPFAPAPVVLAQLDLRHGSGTGERLGLALLDGVGLEAAAAVAGVPPEEVSAWDRPYPDQDYLLEVDPASPAVTVTREAPAGAPAETVLIAADGAQLPITLGPGPDQETLPLLERPRRVVLDPDLLLAQRSRTGDAWPPRWNVTVAGWLQTVALDPFFVEGSAGMWVRRRWATRDTWSGQLYIDRETLFGTQLAWSHQEGRLLDGISRPHRFVLWGSPALLNPAFAETDGRFALGAGVRYAWDTRVAQHFPLRGHRIAVGVDGGLIPGTDQTWAAIRAGASGVTSPHPRLALAGRLVGGIAKGDVPQRLLSLGGTGAMRSLPPELAWGTRRTAANAEIRLAPIRQASVPALLAWGNELQLTGGVEAGAVETTSGTVTGVGVTGGIAVVADVLGFEPRMIGVTAGWPVHLEGAERPALPTVYLQWGPAF